MTVTAADGTEKNYVVTVQIVPAYTLTVKVTGSVAGSARVQIGDKTYTLSTDGSGTDGQQTASVVAGESIKVIVADKTTANAAVAGDSNCTGGATVMLS